MERGKLRMVFDMKEESEIFDKAASYYDLYRPSYPGELVEELVKHTHIDKHSKTLEIGAGSGKATELLVSYGFHIHCIDAGENLVKKGQKKFSGNKNISYECIRFEDMKDSGERYDTIFSAQAFHWVPQPVGYEKCARFLKKDGYLAPFWNMYLYDDREEDQKLIELLDKYGGFYFVTETEAENRIMSIVQGFEDSGLFHSPTVYRQYWEKEYTADEYYGFLQTTNGFLKLPEGEKRNAYNDIVELAEQFGGKIKRPYLAVLYMARKKSGKEEL